MNPLLSNLFLAKLFLAKLSLTQLSVLLPPFRAICPCLLVKLLCPCLAEVEMGKGRSSFSSLFYSARERLYLSA